MVAVVQAVGDPDGVVLEVDAAARRRRRLEPRRQSPPVVEAGPLEHDELGGVADPAALLAPGRAPADEASVDEDDAAHRCH